MSDDKALALLYPMVRKQQLPAVWVLDEHGAGVAAGAANAAVTVLSNRFDVAGEMGDAGWRSRFCDVDFSDLKDGSMDAVFLRLAKEKPLVHHVVNAAARCLAPGGRLLLSGGKQQGIKTYAKNAASRLAGAAQIEKYGNEYLAVITRGSASAGEALDDRDYTQLRIAVEEGELAFWSKPGLYGWDKVDEGSALLAAHLPQFTARAERVCDLGCGYGYLSLHAWRQYAPQRLLATDNNAAALLACGENLRPLGEHAAVLASDCADGIDERFDLVLCNPPFHQGFDVERDLTERFVAAARRLLQQGGCAAFVTNSFIPIERVAAPWFGRVERVAENGRFKLTRLQP